MSEAMVPVVAIGEEIVLRHELGARDADSQRRKWFILLFGLLPLVIVNVGFGLWIIFWTLGSSSWYGPLILMALYLFIFMPASAYQCMWMIGIMGWVYPIGRQEILRPGELEIRNLAGSGIYKLRDAELSMRRRGYLGLMTITVSDGRRKAVLQCVTRDERKIVEAYHEAANTTNGEESTFTPTNPLPPAVPGHTPR